MDAKVEAARYTVVIQWSEEDQCFIASLPEWRSTTYSSAHGSTYEEAAAHARETLEFLIRMHDPAQEGPLPTPKLFHYPGADVVDVPDEKPTNRRSSAVA